MFGFVAISSHQVKMLVSYLFRKGEGSKRDDLTDENSVVWLCQDNFILTPFILVYVWDIVEFKNKFQGRKNEGNSRNELIGKRT